MKRNVALYGVLITLALMASYVESLFPVPIPVPGIKLGLANAVTMAVLYLFGVGPTFFVSCIRIVVSGFLFGNVFAIIYSLGGGLLSLGVMCILHRMNVFSVVGVSVTGGVAHNMGQLIVACLVVQNGNLFYYFPVLLVAGVITGLVIGLVDQEILKRISGKGNR